MGPRIQRKYFLITNYKKNNCLNVFKCCFPSWVCLCIAVIIQSFDNCECKQCVKFTDILGDSLVISVTGFGKIRYIKLSSFIFDCRGVSGMCVFDIFCCFRGLSWDCPLHGGVPYIGNERYLCGIIL